MVLELVFSELVTVVRPGLLLGEEDLAVLRTQGTVLAPSESIVDVVLVQTGPQALAGQGIRHFQPSGHDFSLWGFCPCPLTTNILVEITVPIGVAHARAEMYNINIKKKIKNKIYKLGKNK